MPYSVLLPGGHLDFQSGCRSHWSPINLPELTAGWGVSDLSPAPVCRWSRKKSLFLLMFKKKAPKCSTDIGAVYKTCLCVKTKQVLPVSAQHPCLPLMPCLFEGQFIETQFHLHCVCVCGWGSQCDSHVVPLISLYVLFSFFLGPFCCSFTCVTSWYNESSGQQKKPYFVSQV